MTAKAHTKAGARILQRVYEAWSNAGLEMRRMSGFVNIKPEKPADVFRLVGADEAMGVKIDILPVVFNLPERRSSGKPNLYVVVKGWLIFEGPDYKQVPLLTKEFGTEIAYFRSKGKALHHVYGAHYDMDEVLLGHPVFHAQMKSMAAMSHVAIDRFNLGSDVSTDDAISGVLGTVRTPSSQMDLFSVMIQLSADHLLGKGAGPVELEAFSNLRKSCDFLRGAAHRMDFMNHEAAAKCYRATHWYASPVAAKY
jgi:hypothetical protein